MAAYLELTERKTGEIISGTKLIALDNQIAQKFNIPSDPDRWAFDWMDSIGFALALGNSFPRVRELFADSSPEIIELINYLEARFENTSFISR